MFRMSWRARNRRDFAIGEAFGAEPERYASVAAILKRPVEPVRMRPQPELILAPPRKPMIADPVPEGVRLSQA